MSKEYFERGLGEYLSFLERYVSIESGTSNIEGVGRCVDFLISFADKLKSCQCEKLTGGNNRAALKIRRSGEKAGKKILLLGHTDTIFPEGSLSRNPFRIEGDHARGPGVADMKGGVAAVLFLLKAAEDLDAKLPEIEVLINGDEETGSHESVDMIEKAAAEARAVLLFEPGRENGALVTGRKGVGQYSATVKGRAAHAGTNHSDGRNAIVEMSHKILQLSALTNYENGNTVNVGVIAGGTVSNAVPGSCEIAVDVRYQKLELVGDLNGQIEAVLKLNHTPDVSTEFIGGVNRPPMEQTPENLALFNLYAEIAGEIGYPVSHVYVGGGSDGNFTGALGIPTLDGMGPCGAKFHSEDEFMVVSSVVPRMHIALEMLKRM